MATNIEGETTQERSNITKVRAIEDKLFETLYETRQLRKDIESADEADQEEYTTVYEPVRY